MILLIIEPPEFLCSFEDDLCPLVNYTTATETWTLAQPYMLTTITVDNTLNIGSPSH